jgi:hypothetical protein
MPGTPKAIVSNRFSGSQRCATDYFSVRAQCSASLGYDLAFIEPAENIHAFALRPGGGQDDILDFEAMTLVRGMQGRRRGARSPLLKKPLIVGVALSTVLNREILCAACHHPLSCAILAADQNKFQTVQEPRV